MTTIVIKNIGPLKSVEFHLNKINVFMGPQSSGKSTVAKIISFCQWAEKRFMLDGKFEYDIMEQFIGFHRISEEYFSEDSFFEYDTDFVNIKYVGLSFKVTIIEKQSKSYIYKKSRNIFIPAERNFVSAIPNLRRYNETNDNIMNFVYDWYEAKGRYTRTKNLKILNFPLSYHHVKDSDSDIIRLENKKEIELKFASSGLQSVTPLIVLVDYLTDSFFSESKSPSVDEKVEIANIFIKNFDYIFDSTDRMKELNEILENKINKFQLTDTESNRILGLISNRKNYYHTNFVIEEPEQNLFPETQRDLIYYLFDKIQDKVRNHNLVLTTHSPFILYAINNCIMGFNIKGKMPSDEKRELPSYKSWIDPNTVSIWQIKNGEMFSVIDLDTKTVTKHYFNESMNEILNEYYEMLSYFEYDRPSERKASEA